MPIINDAIKKRIDRAEARTTAPELHIVESLEGFTPPPGKRWLVVSTGVPRPDPNAPELRDIQQQPPIDPWRGTPFACQDIARDPDEKVVPETAPAVHAEVPPMKQQLDGITEALRERAWRDEMRQFDINFVPSGLGSRQ